VCGRRKERIMKQVIAKNKAKKKKKAKGGREFMHISTLP